MLTTAGLIFLCICLLVIGAFIEAGNDSCKYNESSCYKRDYYTCLECSKKHCNSHKLAEKLYELERTE